MAIMPHRSKSLGVPLRLTIATVMLDIGTEWTLNASLTRLSRYRRCSKRRISGHSAQATSRLRIEGTMKCLRIARGFAFGSGMASVAEPSPRHSDYPERGIELPANGREKWRRKTAYPRGKVTETEQDLLSPHPRHTRLYSRNR